MMEEPLYILVQLIWACALGIYPLGFLFAACSPCCEPVCQMGINLSGCLKELNANGVLSTRSLAPQVARAGTISPELSSGFGADPVRVYEIATRAEVKLRLTIFGMQQESRTLVFRFNQLYCASGCSGDSSAISYDDTSPGWHLETEVRINIVGDEDQEGIVSQSLGNDSAGQPKVFLEINFFNRLDGSARRFDLEPLEIFPTGIQRRYTIGTTNGGGGQAAVVSGEESVARLTIASSFLSEKAYAATFYGRPKWLYDTSGFFGGETISVEHADTTHRSITLTPSTVLCDIPANRLGIGIAIGVYPGAVGVSIGPRESLQCISAGDIQVVAKPDGLCGAGAWVARDIQANLRTLRYSVGSVRAEDFFRGTTILANMELGPYRTEFVDSRGHRWTLGGTDINIDRFYQSGIIPWLFFPSTNYKCRSISQGTVSGTCIPRKITVNYPEIEIDGHYPPFPCYDATVATAKFPGGTVELSLGAGSYYNLGQFYNPDLLALANSLIPPAGRMFYFSAIKFNVEGEADGRQVLWAFRFLAAVYVSECDKVETVGVSVICLPAMGGTISRGDGQADSFAVGTPCVDDGINSVVKPYLARGFSGGEIEVRPPLRIVCDPWEGPSVAPAVGGAVYTQRCVETDAPGEAPHLEFTGSIGPITSGNVVDASILEGAAILRGRCGLIGVRDPASEDTSRFRPTAGSPCKLLIPLFGNNATGPGVVDCDAPSVIEPPTMQFTDSGSGSPCLSTCDVTVAVTENDDQLSAEYIPEGETAGAIRLTARAGWSINSSAKLLISCGDDSIEVTITG